MEDGLNRGMACGKTSKTATICEFVNAFGWKYVKIGNILVYLPVHGKIVRAAVIVEAAMVLLSFSASGRCSLGIFWFFLAKVLL